MKSKINIKIQLYSILREKLPPGSHGQAILHFDQGVTLQELLSKLDISGRVVISVNDKHENDLSHRLQDGDNIKIFSSISGG